MAALTNGTVLNNRYRIIAPIAEGGFGAVYRAEDQALRRPCAVKENSLFSSAAQQQFKREASLLAGLNHPALPRVTDRFDIENRQYLVMDYVAGHSLKELLGSLDARRSVIAIIEVAKAVQYLHSQIPPIFHRDIKPANIIIRHDGRIMLVDFGIAHLHDQTDKLRAGAQAVTDGYSPPEQYQGETDARSDVYALAATLFALISGSKPPISIARLQGVELDLNLMPQPIQPMIHTAMEMAPHRRYTTMQAFGRALAQVVDQL